MMTHVCPRCGTKMDGPFACTRTNHPAHPRTESVPIKDVFKVIRDGRVTAVSYPGRPTTEQSAQALEDATKPVDEPKQPELLADDGVDI